MDQDLRNRVNSLEGEVDTLETIMAEMVAAVVSNRLVDLDLLRAYPNNPAALKAIRAQAK